MDVDSDQSESHVAAYFRRWIQRHQEAPGCLSKATQDPTCKICFQGFVRLKSFCKHAKIHFEQNAMKCSFCGEQFFSKDALANHMRMPLESGLGSRSPSPLQGNRPFFSVYKPNTARDSTRNKVCDSKGYLYRKERSSQHKTYWKCVKYDRLGCPARYHTSHEEYSGSVGKHNHEPEKSVAEKPGSETGEKENHDPANPFVLPKSKPYTGGAKPPSYWEWVREAYPHIQLSEEVIQQLEAESKNTDQVNDEASFQAMVDLIMGREKRKQAESSGNQEMAAQSNRSSTSGNAAPSGTINCHLCNANIRRYDYQAHMLVAHSAAATQAPKFFSCTVCNKSFANSRDLFQHKMQAHPEPVPTHRAVPSLRQCNLCGESCQNLDELTQHALHVHGVGGGVTSEPANDNITCPLCGTYRFSRLNRDQFDRHLMLYCQGRVFAQKLATKRMRDLSTSLSVDPMHIMRLQQECKLLQWNEELSESWASKSGLTDRNVSRTVQDGLFFMKVWNNELEAWHVDVPTEDYIRLEAEAERFGPFAFGEYNRQVEPAVERLLPRPADPGAFKLEYDSLLLASKVDNMFKQYNLCEETDIERSRVRSLWEEALNVGRANEARL